MYSEENYGPPPPKLQRLTAGLSIDRSKKIQQLSNYLSPFTIQRSIGYQPPQHMVVNAFLLVRLITLIWT